jgi:hypothetical protein
MKKKTEYFLQGAFVNILESIGRREKRCEHQTLLQNAKEEF